MRWLAVIALCGLAGCAPEMPIAQNFPSTAQRVMNSVNHWQALSMQTAACLTKTTPCDGEAARPQQSAVTVQPGGAQPARRVPSPVRLVRQTPPTEFSAGFEDLLTTSLLRQGVVVTDDPTVADTIAVNVRVVHHEFPVVGRTGFTYLGTFLGMTVWAAATQPAVAFTAVPGIGLGAGALFDTLRWYAPEATATEVIVSTVVASGPHRIAAHSETFYVQTADAAAYRASDPPAKPQRTSRYQDW